MKILNYLALGLPVVAAEGSAIEIPGVLPVPNHDAQALAQSIKNILSDPTRLRNLGLAGQESVQSNYSWGNQCKKLEQIYTKLLSKVH